MCQQSIFLLVRAVSRSLCVSLAVLPKDSRLREVPRRLVSALERLALDPPQVLLLEGGSEQTRLALAVHWAKTAACPTALRRQQAQEPAAPCLVCPVCNQIDARESLDLRLFDGRISNKQDEEKPGPIRALNMENMHSLRAVTGTAPHGAGRRLAIFQGMSQTREEALNSLLKTLEEPTPHTLFALLAPQRAQLLPTLVSRSFCLTLPWRGCQEGARQMTDWERLLARFFNSGQGLMDTLGTKGAVDATGAGEIILACQRSLARVLGDIPQNDLDQVLSPLAGKPASALLLSRWANEALAMLAGTVSPARVLEAFCSRLFVLLRAKPR